MRLTREFILGSRLTVLLPPMLLYDEYTLNLLMACHAIIVMCTSYSLHLGMGARISDLFFTEKQCHCKCQLRNSAHWAVYKILSCYVGVLLCLLYMTWQKGFYSAAFPFGAVAVQR